MTRHDLFNKMKFMVLALLILSAPVSARAEEPDLVAVSAGVYDVLDSETAGEARLEYRWQTPLFWRVSPFIGVMGTTDSAAYGYGGLGADIKLTENWIFNPNFAIGAYKNGNGKDLGHGLEFRSGAEIAYKFQNDSRLGLSFHHISNASLGNENPGTESVVLTYGIPVNFFTAP